MKIIYISIIGLAIALSSCKSSGGSSSGKVSELKTTADSVSYIIGANFSKNFKRDITNEENPMHDYYSPDAYIQGVIDAIEKDSSLMLDMELGKQLVQKLQQKAYEKKQLEEQEALKPKIEEGEKFLNEISRKDGVVTLPSGLRYEIIKEGNGAKPTLTDQVKVHYHGTLTNGKVFDSSVDRGEPLPLFVNGVIKGWTEALQLMPTGSKWKLYIPYDLAYGAQGSGPIGPYETLIFDVELLEIMEGAAGHDDHAGHNH